ncbi:MAG: 16S rRNA (adenine(1518)-N(6)/adenine(1519)-N(6))-dimethyltransferase RsmA [Gammaproteobacteria bacterium]|nr:16S rRNA (adenine(1518)-N(6)/adenine(1519)-N(6))-dimethyltransferase RsmA [Gammaproteobacteria bacterium]
MSHRPRKRFGQNFLHDQSVIERILMHVDPQPGQHIVEIGPGQGALTQGLLKRAGRIDAIELDRDLLEPLRRRCDAIGALTLHNADALKFDFRSLATDGRKLRLVGNLPYNISTPLLFHLVEQADVIEDMHFMLQKEVVDRMAAGPGSKTYGRLSVMLQIRCAVTPLFDIGPQSFDPPPKVDSSVVRLVPLAEPMLPIDELNAFGGFVTAAFAQRRKTLRNNLKGLLDADGIAGVGIDPAVRSESLSIAQLADLFHASQAQVTMD